MKTPRRKSPARASTQKCPVCGQTVNPNPRYPRYLCRACAKQATDEAGRKLEFGNTDIGGGFEARYADAGKIRRSHVCFVKGIRCWADEARFGGIVLEAVEDRFMGKFNSLPLARLDWRKMTNHRMKRPSMTLTTEGGFRDNRPTPGLVRRVVNKLDTGQGNSFCCLESADHNYVQTMHGLNGWHLEWREPGRPDIRQYRHYRAASLVGSNRRRLLRKSDKFVSCGLECDLLNAKEVEQCFLTFLRSEERPKDFKWRQLKI